MADSNAPDGDTYGRLVGLIYLFNLIVGTGALTMPFAFKEAGWLLSIIGISVLAFMSFVTATFMVEAMGAANALFRLRTLQHYKKVSNQHDTANSPAAAQDQLVNQMRNDDVLGASIDHDERVPLLVNCTVETVAESSSVDYFAITERFEMGKMAGMFYSPWGIRIFYACIAIYLYGDLAIYAAAVAKSIREAACERGNGTATNLDEACWTGYGITKGNAYRLFLLAFAVAVGPFTFFNVQKTKYLQVVTTILRWKAFASMIVLCLIAIIGGKAEGHPSPANFKELPALFGVCVYSFMCHHSLPSLVTPIKPKLGLNSLILGDFVIILIFYNLLSLTGVFTFENLRDVYTLNFEPSNGPSVVPVIPYFQYFLMLFPVLTLSSNFPIIAITLTNNLRTLFLSEDSSWWMKSILLPLIALVPPCLIALAVESVDFLVNITGAYAGAMIQYVIPATLVYLARREVGAQLGPGVQNTHASPFKSRFWIHFVMGWTCFCIVFVSVHLITKLIGKPGAVVTVQFANQSTVFYGDRFAYSLDGL